MGSTQSTWGSIRTIITQQPSSLGYVITQYLHKPTLQSTTGSITLQLPTMLFATIITPALLFASSSLAQMSMPGINLNGHRDVNAWNVNVVHLHGPRNVNAQRYELRNDHDYHGVVCQVVLDGQRNLYVEQQQRHSINKCCPW